MRGLFRNKKMVIIIACVLVFVLIAVAGMVVYSKVTAELNKAKQEFADLQAQIDGVGGIVSVCTVANDTKSSKQLTDSDIAYTSCTVAASTGLITDSSELVGKYLKTSLQAGEVISKNNVAEFALEDDLRYLDVVTDENPLGIEIGDYVDITVDFPFGQHYVAMTHKQVVDINSGILKLVVDQNDIYAYESMKVDRATYQGTVIKAIEYVEAGVQQAADRKYPLGITTLTVAVTDPKFTMPVTEAVMAERRQLDTTLSTSFTEEMAKAIEKEKSGITKLIEQAQEDLTKQLEKEAKEAAKN